MYLLQMKFQDEWRTVDIHKNKKGLMSMKKILKDYGREVRIVKMKEKKSTSDGRR